MKVLTAEDDLTSRLMLTALLKTWGYEPEATGDGLEAWQEIQRPGAPRLVILDWNMPGMDGIEIIRRTRALNLAEPPYIIILTSRDHKHDVVEGLNAGANDYIAKPYDPDELRARIEVGRRMVGMQALLAQQREALRESESFNKSILDNLPVGIAVNSVDPAVTFHYMNDNFPAFYRTSREQLAGPDSFWSAAYEDPEFRDTIRKQVLEDCASGDPQRMVWVDLPIRRKGEETTYITARNIPLPDKGVMISTLWDVTERKKIEQALLESEARLVRAQSVAHIGNWELDLATNTIWASDEAFRIYGLERMSPYLPLARAQQIPHAEDRPRLDAALRGLLQTNSTYDEVFRIVRVGDGESRVIHTVARLERDAAGAPVKVVGVIQDITERKRVESLLLREQALYKDLVNTIPIGTYRLRMRAAAGREGERERGKSPVESQYFIDMVSDRFCEITGISRQAFEANARCILERIHPDDIPEFVRRNAEAVASVSFFGWEGRLVVPGKGTVWVHLESIPHPLENGEVMWTGIVYDISERKQAEEDREKLQAQLLQSQKMESVGRLAGGVAHDFNNMLGVIIGHTEMALAEVASASPLHGDLEEIQKAALRSAELTRQLLAFARKQTVSPRVLDLNRTVASMLKMLQRLIGENIELAWQPGPELWPVKMDPSQVDQILANLAVNARDAIAGVGHLTIKTENVAFDGSYCRTHEGFTPGDYVLLAVSDTGAGMDKETLQHVFEPFFTTKEVGKGTGLGLAMVYGAVKQNRGFINVTSEPGQGAIFKIYLPRAEAAAAAAAEAQKQPAHGTETVLLAEDEESILKLGTAILSKHGYTVLAARTPAEALALADRHEGPIQLLITDVVMPGMNGKELQARLLALRPGIRVLFMSGYTSDVIAHQGVLDKDVEFLQKPFSVNALAQKVREVLQ